MLSFFFFWRFFTSSFASFQTQNKKKKTFPPLQCWLHSQLFTVQIRVYFLSLCSLFAVFAGSNSQTCSSWCERSFFCVPWFSKHSWLGVSSVDLARAGETDADLETGDLISASMSRSSPSGTLRGTPCSSLVFLWNLRLHGQISCSRFLTPDSSMTAGDIY